MLIYDTQRSGNAWKVRLMAGFLGVGLTRKTLSLDRGDLQTEEWKRIAPLRQVPLVVLEDGTHLAESFAILFYLARDSVWWPKDLQAQANVLSWLSFEQERHMKPLARRRLHLSLLKDVDESDARMRNFAKEAHEALRILDRQLSLQGPTGWVATANHPSIADVALFPYARMSPLAGVDLAVYPAVQAWLDRFESLPAYEPLVPGRPELTLGTVEFNAT